MDAGRAATGNERNRACQRPSEGHVVDDGTDLLQFPAVQFSMRSISVDVRPIDHAASRAADYSRRQASRRPSGSRCNRISDGLDVFSGGGVEISRRSTGHARGCPVKRRNALSLAVRTPVADGGVDGVCTPQ